MYPCINMLKIDKQIQRLTLLTCGVGGGGVVSFTLYDIQRSNLAVRAAVGGIGRGVLHSRDGGVTV